MVVVTHDDADTFARLLPDTFEQGWVGNPFHENGGNFLPANLLDDVPDIDARDSLVGNTLLMPDCGTARRDFHFSEVATMTNRLKWKIKSGR